jgi:hypothetical protein
VRGAGIWSKGPVPIERNVDQSQLAVVKVAQCSEREMLRVFASDVR